MESGLLCVESAGGPEFGFRLVSQSRTPESVMEGGRKDGRREGGRLSVSRRSWSCTGPSRRVLVDEVLKTSRRARGTARRQDCIGELDEVLKTSLPWAGDRYCGNCAALPYNVSELGLRLAASGVVPKRAWKLPVMPLRPVLPLRVEVVCQ